MLFRDHKVEEPKLTPRPHIHTVLSTQQHVLLSTTEFNCNNCSGWPDHKGSASILWAIDKPKLYELNISPQSCHVRGWTFGTACFLWPFATPTVSRAMKACKEKSHSITHLPSWMAKQTGKGGYIIECFCSKCLREIVCTALRISSQSQYFMGQMAETILGLGKNDQRNSI